MTATYSSITAAQSIATDLRRFCRRLDIDNSPISVTVKPDDEGFPEVNVNCGAVYLTCNWPMKIKTFAGVLDASGYRVWAIKVHPASRWLPSEEEDVTLLETLNVREAFAEVVAQLARYEFDAQHSNETGEE